MTGKMTGNGYNTTINQARMSFAGRFGLLARTRSFGAHVSVASIEEFSAQDEKRGDEKDIKF